MSDAEPLHVLALQARNFMGLHVLELDVDDEGMIAAGDNGAGKSSALAILAAAFGGSKAEPAVPIHAGTFSAEIAVVVGRDGRPAYRVEKTWETGKPARLTVYKVAADGAMDKQTSPQKILDGLLDLVTFDVGAFIQPPGAKTPEAAAKEQTATLLRACPLDVDLDALAVQRKRLYDERTLVKRDLDTAGAELRTKAKAAVPERVDLDEKRATIAAARTKAEARRRVAREVAAIDEAIVELKARYKKLTENRAALVAEDAALGDIADVSALEAEVTAGERTNEERIRVGEGNAQYEKLMARLGEKKRRADALTEEIEALDKKKLDALARAAFPVPGLGIDEVLGVTYAPGDGSILPYAQVNLAKKVEIAFQVLAKLNPTLRVALIRDGNDLDRKTLAALRRTAAVLRVQIFVERVALDVPGSVIFENGRVVGHVAQDGGR